MKFMEKAKRFFTLNAANHEGFTLVELIVVIAILAILAGVAVPVYSGYIKRAEKAADLQLLGAINDAFAAACMSEGVDIRSLTGSTATIKIVDGLISEVNPAELRTSFALFYQGNETTKFKVITNLVFENGVFVDANDATGVSVTFGENNYNIKQSAIDAFSASVFADKVPEMQTQLNGLSTAFTQVVGSADAAADISEGFAQYLKDNNIPNDQIGNAAVLYVAENAANYSAQDIANKFQELSTKNITSMGEMLKAFGEDEDPLTSAALMYGAVTAFANSDACTDENFKKTVSEVNGSESLFNVFASMSTNETLGKEWGAYMGNIAQDGSNTIIMNDQFASDVNGFLGAMDAINTVSPDVNLGTENLWSSTEINGLLGNLNLLG